ncbi:hypothetical protein PFISCL1PPCAC_11883, partial [Pristionchus fissidentatus]
LKLWNRVVSYIFNNKQDDSNISDSEEVISIRPVCIRGALQHKIGTELIRRHRELFECGVERTSCARFAGLSGPFYKFVPEAKMVKDICSDRYLECRKIDDDFYGMTFDSVKQTLKKGRHFILEIKYSKALRRLQSIAKIHPIVISVVSSSPEQIMNWDDTDEINAQIMFRIEQKEEEAFADLVTHSISDAQSFEDVVQQVLAICAEQRNEVDRDTVKVQIE